MFETIMFETMGDPGLACAAVASIENDAMMGAAKTPPAAATFSTERLLGDALTPESSDFPSLI
jgi:hypothetical protein